jgi:hypothetical protein
MELTPIRLLPDDPNGWLWWPAFEARVKNFTEKYSPETDGKSLAFDLRQRFVNTPNFTGYWLVLDENSKPVAHCVCWLGNQYNRYYIFGLQAEADDGYKLDDVANLVMAEIDEWAKKVNKTLPAGAGLIDRCELCTFRDAPVWMRYLKMHNRGNAQVRSVIRFDLNVGQDNV